MELRFAPLFSGSSGNAVYVGCDETHLLIDAGVSGSRVTNELRAIGIDPHSLSGILVTHEHRDHIAGVGVLSRKFDLPIFATPGTWSGMEGKIGAVASKNVRMIDPFVSFFLGNIEVMAFSTPHDANESVGYTFELDTARFALATDIGCIKDQWMNAVEGTDAVLLESNYDPNMLEVGPYPYELKKRIASRKGHLSNDDCAAAAVRLVNAGAKQLVLGHLSAENNFPDLAEMCTRNILFSEGIEVGADVELRVAKRDGLTGIFSVRSEL